MRHFICGTMAKAVLLAIAILTSGCGYAHALEYNDIALLRQHQVADDVIISMAGEQGITALTADQENRLRAEGASENFLVALRNAASRAPSNAAVTTPTPMYADQEAVPYAQGYTEAPMQLDERSVAVAASQPVMPLRVTENASLPPRYDKEGWLSISNTDLRTYYLSVDAKAKRMFLSAEPNGGYEIPPGENRAINTRKEEYKLYGDSGSDLKVRVRESEVTRLSLVPFGVVGNSGLNGIVRDRERTRSEVLIANYVPVPQVVVQPAPVVVVPARPYYPAVPYYGPYRYGPYRRYHYGW